MKKIALLATASMIIAVFALSACAGMPPVPEIDVIQTDIVRRGERIMSATLTISDLEIIETELNEDARTVDFRVEVRADDGEAEHKMFVRVDYSWNNDLKEWVLDRANPYDEDKWTITPIAGVKDDVVQADLINSLRWEQINIDGEMWFFDEDNFEGFKIDSRNTQLSQSKETVNVTFNLNDVILVATGQFQLEYDFDGGGWRLTDCRSTAPFTASERTDAILEVSQDDVLAEVLDMRLPFLVGNSWNRTTQQIIDLTSDEVSGFNCNDVIQSNKGTLREYFYSFKLDKGLVIFDVSVYAKYDFDRMNGWMRDDLVVDLSVDSVDFEGTKWVGEHTFSYVYSSVNPPRPMILEITDVASNGATYAVVTFDIEDEGEIKTLIHNVEGIFTKETLSIDLSFKEWVSTPIADRGLYGLGGVRAFMFEQGMQGYLSVGDMMLVTTRRDAPNYHDFDLKYTPDGIQ